MKFIVEQHSDGFIAYPLGLKGVVIGQGDTRDAALADAQSAAKFHRDTFGSEATNDHDIRIKDEFGNTNLR